MKKTTVVLSLFLVCAVAYAVYLQTEVTRLKQEIARGDTVVMREEGDSLAPNESELVQSPAVEAPSAATPVVSEEAVEERRPSREERRRERMERMAAAFDDPQIRVDMIERQMNRVDSRYSDFFKSLDLSAEDMDTLRALMAERGVVDWEMRMRRFGAESEEEREALDSNRAQQHLFLDEQIAALLGDDGAVALEEYTEGVPYRGEVEALATSLSFTESPLSSAQSEALVRVIRNVSQGHEYSVDLSNMRRRGGAEVSSEQIDTYFAEREAFDNRILEDAESSLDDSQLAAYAERQLAERERDRRQLEFMQQNPGGGGLRGGGRRGL